MKNRLLKITDHSNSNNKGNVNVNLKYKNHDTRKVLITIAIGDPAFNRGRRQYTVIGCQTE